MVCISAQSTREILMKLTNVTHAAVPELVGVQPASFVVLTREQQHRSAQPGSSAGALLLLATLPPLR